MTVLYRMETKQKEVKLKQEAMRSESPSTHKSEYIRRALCRTKAGGKEDPAESRKNDLRQKRQVESTAAGRGAMSPQAKLVAEWEQSGKQKKRPAPEGAG
jgi:hypothetical protein